MNKSVGFADCLVSLFLFELWETIESIVTLEENQQGFLPKSFQFQSSKIWNMTRVCLQL